MSWFSNAANVFRRTAQTVEHPFELNCPCGQRHRGMRRGRSQRIICRTCGTALFVLPRDVYPAPRRRAAAQPPDEPRAPVLQPVVEDRPRPGRVDFPADEKSAARSAKKPAGKPEKGSDPEELPQFLTVPERRRRFTPFRLVLVVILGSLAGTGALLVRAWRREQATQVLRTAGDDARAALERHEWGEALTKLESAVAAIDVLGRDDLAARQLQQSCRELRALNRLCPVGLPELFAEAREHASELEDWRSLFDARYLGTWIVLESPLVKDDDSGGPASWCIELPALLEGQGDPARIAADLNAFKSLESLDAETSLIFAAQLEACEHEKGRWILRLNPETGFLWSSLETYEAVGFEFDEWRPRTEVEELLRRQSAHLDLVEDAA